MYRMPEQNTLCIRMHLTLRQNNSLIIRQSQQLYVVFLSINFPSTSIVCTNPV